MNTLTFAAPRLFKQWLAILALTLGLSGLATAQQAPDEFMQQLTNELLDMVRKDPALKAGDLQKIGAVLDTKLKPYINFQRMTAAAVGPAWRQATPEQQKRLQEEFKLLLMRSYSGALSQVKDNSSIVVKPLRQGTNDNEMVVRSEIRGGAEPIPIDYRLEKTADSDSGWRIYNFNILGIWLVDNYRTQFSQEINAKGIDGLIATLSERNKTNNRK
ncbi:MAG: ABC transporter substrate-binding protein [Betaproteobacteria bacterium]|nr:ABC transporter substrate-binding protein [Betaproteobacteria bacterium]